MLRQIFNSRSIQTGVDFILTFGPKISDFKSRLERLGIQYLKWSGTNRWFKIVQTGSAAELQPKMNGIGSKWTVRRDENVRPSGIKTANLKLERAVEKIVKLESFKLVRTFQLNDLSNCYFQLHTYHQNGLRLGFEKGAREDENRFCPWVDQCWMYRGNLPLVTHHW